MSERQDSRLSREWRITTGVLLGAAVLTYAVVEASGTKSPTEAYRATYTEAEECLHGTAYDPETGAVVNVNRLGDETVLSVLPRAANSESPAVLFFTVNSDGFFSDLTLTPADHQTIDYLNGTTCSNKQSGM